MYSNLIFKTTAPCIKLLVFSDLDNTPTSSVSGCCSVGCVVAPSLPACLDGPHHTNSQCLVRKLCCPATSSMHKISLTYKQNGGFPRENLVITTRPLC